MEHYIYVYCDTRKPGSFKFGEFIFDYEPIYVGKGYGNRDTYHLKYVCVNQILSRKLAKIKEANKEPEIIRLIQGLTEIEANEAEILLIKTIGRLNLHEGTLCNMTDGGEGCRRLVQSAEHREKNAKANRGTYEERYGIETAARLKRHRSKQISGGKNPCSKKYKILKPNGEIIEIHSLKSFCHQTGLTYNVLRRNVGKGPIVKKSIKDNSFLNSRTKQLIEGWQIDEVK